MVMVYYSHIFTIKKQQQRNNVFTMRTTAQSFPQFSFRSKRIHHTCGFGFGDLFSSSCSVSFLTNVEESKKKTVMITDIKTPLLNKSLQL